MTLIDSTVARLTALHPKLIDLTLDRMWRILAALGHPERQLPPVIHVAGTNGKGSTIAFMRAILEAAGLPCTSIPRRISCASTSASGSAQPHGGDGRSATMSSPTRLPNANAPMRGAPITVFEITTAAGFVMFARHPADVLLLEVGLGGRLDATNVVDRPLASVITPVSFDHAEHLGDSVERDRRGEGRDPQVRRPCHRGGAAARGAGGDRAPSGAGAGADQDSRRGLDGH